MSSTLLSVRDAHCTASVLRLLCIVLYLYHYNASSFFSLDFIAPGAIEPESSQVMVAADVFNVPRSRRLAPEA